jgi:outer membrane cobalamin receptor
MVNGMAKNLFDEDYEETFGFSAPGQSFFIGVELTL